MVECGGCNQRFRVVDDVIIRERKYFPGERKDPLLQQFRRTPLKEVPNPQFKTIERMPDTPPPMPGAMSPMRSLVGVIGVLIALILLLLFVFGGNQGGLLAEASLNKRLVLAGFGAFVAGLLIVIGYPAARKRAVMASLLIAVGLLGVVFYLAEDLSDGATTDGVNAQILPDEEVGPIITDPYVELKKEVGYNKLEETLITYGEERIKNGQTAYGIWLREMRLSHKSQVSDYLKRVLSASDNSWMYSRPPSDYLMVLDRVSPDLTAIIKHCERFGKVRRTWPELHLLEVVVDPTHFAQPKMSDVTDPNNPSFYQRNRNELGSIDTQRALAAVKRLGSAPPTAFRSDIVNRLHELLQLNDDDMQAAVTRTLDQWTEDNDGSLAAVREAAKSYFERNQTLPRSMVEFLTSRRDEASVDLLHQLWLTDMSGWETKYGDMGSLIEDKVLATLPQLEPSDQFSAVRLLRRVGTEKSLAPLQALKQDAVPEMRELIDQAVAAINDRQ